MKLSARRYMQRRVLVTISHAAKPLARVSLTRSEALRHVCEVLEACGAPAPRRVEPGPYRAAPETSDSVTVQCVHHGSFTLDRPCPCITQQPACGTCWNCGRGIHAGVAHVCTEEQEQANAD